MGALSWKLRAEERVAASPTARARLDQPRLVVLHFDEFQRPFTQWETKTTAPVDFRKRILQPLERYLWDRRAFPLRDHRIVLLPVFSGLTLPNLPLDPCGHPNVFLPLGPLRNSFILKAIQKLWPRVSPPLLSDEAVAATATAPAPAPASSRTRVLIGLSAHLKPLAHL